jgi:hypothetical protein
MLKPNNILLRTYDLRHPLDMHTFYKKYIGYKILDHF